MRRFHALDTRDKDIVFYAETKADWVYFAPIIEELTESHDRRISYLTSDPADPVLKTENPKIKPFCIGSGTICTILFKSLEAKVFVLTLTDLGTYHLKRSAAYPVHYLYVFHSMVSSHMVFRKNAYDNYDTVLCVGPHHVNEIRKNENVNGLPSKRLIEHGYGRLDTIMKETAKKSRYRPSSGPAKKILIAPSWGLNSITALCIDDLIATTLASGHEVTYRPHPMSLRQEKHVIDRVRDRFSADSRFHLELDIRSWQSLEEADLMISDWSGAALEFALGMERPVLFIDTPRKINNPDYEKLGCEPLEVSIREKIGSVLTPERMRDVPERIASLCNDREKFLDKIRQTRSRWIYNVGSSGRVGAQAILEALELTHAQAQS